MDCLNGKVGLTKIVLQCNLIVAGILTLVYGLPMNAAESRSETDKAQSIQECMQSLRRIVKALEQYSRIVEKQFDLTGPQLWALWELGQFGPVALKELAARMHLDSSTVTGVIDRLSLKGLVVRNIDLSDRRRLSLSLTEKGEEILERAPHPAQGHLLEGLRALEMDQVHSLQVSLRVLESVMNTESLNAPFFFSES